ncbi:MAG: dihydrolipoyl dehydrogenase [Rickettsiales bacterium]|jgi:dihydrolipoamide dehydrogenase|nr:dihydrolipoyl dehydrogenase [Rickettsiales bacterium]
MSEFDLVVIGGGPGGYVAAIRASQLGMNVACVEMRGSLGGTCLNVGCIPSKALLSSSHKFHDAQHHFAEMGIKGNVSLDLPTMLAKKDKIVLDLTKGIEFLFKKNKVTYVKGRGAIKSASEVVVDGKETIKTKRILIATGSDVMRLPGVDIDEKKIVSSTGALNLNPVPQHLVVVGGGVIGLEMGSVWKRLGAKVTVIEYLGNIGGYMDAEVAAQFQKILTKQGIEFKLGMKVTSADSKGKGVSLTVEPAKGGAAEKLEADVVLVSIGRKPYTENLGLEKVGVKLDNRGRIEVDSHFETNVKGIYAIGDVIPGPMLAHKAEEDGVVAVENMMGQKSHIDYNLVPGVVYTWPEVANVGKTEEELKAAGADYKVGKFPFMANSRGKAVGETEGFVKLLADSKTDRLLGAHIIGPDAGTLIHEACLVMEFGGSAEDLARTCHAHPTLNEAVKEAGLAAQSRAIHI